MKTQFLIFSIFFFLATNATDCRDNGTHVICCIPPSLPLTGCGSFSICKENADGSLGTPVLLANGYVDVQNLAVNGCLTFTLTGQQFCGAYPLSG
uniref:Uncharacterized protein n=1 Tax=Acrobeloides nanus TaxID=290746 RepID=A0A914DNQ8_9BILA